MMEIREIFDRQIWDSFTEKFHDSSFLQSWQWGEFAISQGRKIYRLGLYDKSDQLLGVNLMIQVKSKRGDYLESHAGPIMDYQNEEAVNAFVMKLIQLGKQEGIHFIRIRPDQKYTDEGVNRFLSYGFVKAPMYFQAEHTMLLNLTKTEESLMQGLRKQTRYYVKKAKNNGVSIRFSKNAQDLDGFFNLYSETVRRQHFVPYPKTYFKNEFEKFSPDNCFLVFAEYENQITAAALIIIYRDTAYYHHGASIITKPDVFAPYLLQWEVILYLKSLGLKTYDFFGVAPTDDEDQARSGLTTFKRGFGGDRVRYMQTLDYPLSWRYWPLYLYVKYERFRKKL